MSEYKELLYRLIECRPVTADVSAVEDSPAFGFDQKGAGIIGRMVDRVGRDTNIAHDYRLELPVVSVLG